MCGEQLILCQAGCKKGGESGTAGGRPGGSAPYPEGRETGGICGKRLGSAQKERCVGPSHGRQRSLYFPGFHGADFPAAS